MFIAPRMIESLEEAVDVMGKKAVMDILIQHIRMIYVSRKINDWKENNPYALIQDVRDLRMKWWEEARELYPKSEE